MFMSNSKTIKAAAKMCLVKHKTVATTAVLYQDAETYYTASNHQCHFGSTTM